MARKGESGLKKAIKMNRPTQSYWSDLRVFQCGPIGFDPELERAGRVADFIELVA